MCREKNLWVRFSHSALPLILGDPKNIPDMSKTVPVGANPTFDKLVLFICMTPPDKFFGIAVPPDNPICRE